MKAFGDAFAGRDQNAIIVELMTRAMAEQETAQGRADAIDRLLAMRRVRPVVTGENIRATREELREYP